MPDRNGFIDFRAVKAAVTMERILEHYGLKEKLRVSGDDSLTGCCPLHEGHNPTQFRVSLSKNCWKCFSKCQCGGNVLDFIAKKESVSIHEAAHLAAEWFHVGLDDPPPRGNPAPPYRAEQLREVLLRDDVEEYTPEGPRFPLGRLVATPNALAHLTELDIRIAIGRHLRGDWGDICDEDRQANDSALAQGDRLVSVYHSATKVKFYLITEWNRTLTTVLLPEDY